MERAKITFLKLLLILPNKSTPFRGAHLFLFLHDFFYFFEYLFFTLICINIEYLMTMWLPYFEKRKCIADRPCDSFSDSWFSIISSYYKYISCLWIYLTCEACWKSFLSLRINSTTTEALHGCLFIEIKIEDIEASPDRSHGIILFFWSDSAIDKDSLSDILIDEFLRKLYYILCRCLESLLEKWADMFSIRSSILSKTPEFSTHLKEDKIIWICFKNFSSLGSFSWSLYSDEHYMIHRVFVINSILLPSIPEIISRILYHCTHLSRTSVAQSLEQGILIMTCPKAIIMLSTIPFASKRVCHIPCGMPECVGLFTFLPCGIVLSLWYFPYFAFWIYDQARAVSSSPFGWCPDFPHPLRSACTSLGYHMRARKV